MYPQHFTGKKQAEKSAQLPRRAYSPTFIRKAKDVKGRSSKSTAKRKLVINSQVQKQSLTKVYTNLFVEEPGKLGSTKFQNCYQQLLLYFSQIFPC